MGRIVFTIVVMVVVLWTLSYIQNVVEKSYSTVSNKVAIETVNGGNSAFITQEATNSFLGLINHIFVFLRIIFLFF